MFVLRDLPKHETLEAMARRIPQADPGAIESCLYTLRVASDVLDALETHMARYGLSQGRFIVLMLLMRGVTDGGDGSTPSVLADKAGVTRATMTGLLDGLERDGLVQREQGAQDRRNIMIHLTDKGRSFLENMLPDHFRRIAGLMNHLSDGDKKQLVQLLKKINEGIPELLKQ